MFVQSLFSLMFKSDLLGWRRMILLFRSFCWVPWHLSIFIYFCSIFVIVLGGKFSPPCYVSLFPLTEVFDFLKYEHICKKDNKKKLKVSIVSHHITPCKVCGCFDFFEMCSGCKMLKYQLLVKQSLTDRCLSIVKCIHCVGYGKVNPSHAVSCSVMNGWYLPQHVYATQTHS